MFTFRNGNAAVLLLLLTQCFVFATPNYEKSNAKNSTELIGSYLTLPWIDGVNWLVHSSGSSDAKEVKTFIRAIVTGETWATQILDILWEGHPRLKETRYQHSEIYNDCAKAIDHDDTGIQDGYCMVSAVSSVSEHTGLFTSMLDRSLSHKARDDQTEVVDYQSTPRGTKDFSMTEISVILLFSIVSMVLIGCTICDFVKRNRPGNSSATVNTLTKFSLYTNALVLLDTKSTKEIMPAINGIRCLCFWTVMLGHRYLISILVLNEKITLLDFIKTRTSLFGVYVEMALLAVDNFCVIGGFFFAYTFLKKKKSGFHSNVFTMYLYRYLRLTPCLAAVLIFVVVFSHRFGNGPEWEGIITNAIDPCRENWWINLLYLQNVITPDRICMVHTWYLALDMQLFWFSPLILYPLYHTPKFGLSLLSLSIIASIATPVIILAVNGYSNLWLRFDMDFSEILNNFNYYYVATYNRACPHLVGILLGYDVATKRRHLNKVTVAMNWILAGSLILFCTWLNCRTYNAGFTDDWGMEVPTAILLRPLWSIAIAWIIYACTQGYGGLVTKFLSLPIFFPLSRLSYCIYLVHMVIQAITISSFKVYSDPFPVSHLIVSAFGDLVLSTAVAVVLNLFIETPSIVFMKILMNSDTQKKKAAEPLKDCKQKLEKDCSSHFN